MNPVDRLNLYLIKPSKYDDDGYVVRYWKGVLPSNTLACLYGLSEDVRDRKVLGGDLKWRIEAIDETVQRIDVQKIVRSSRRKGTKSIVCLVGVQSNQFPRAMDLAASFRQAGIDVLIGGFHVSGVLATFPEWPSEISTLLDAGVTLVAGEVEGRLESILQDALNGGLKHVYNFLHEPPSLSRAPMPRIPKNLINKYAVRHFTTMDCGRGCPFSCSFCTVINVQGRSMRFRDVECITQQLWQNYREHKISHYFFTDDNFSRNKNWEAIFDSLIHLREKEGLDISFMMQVDTQSHRIPNFVDKAARAGCTQVFIGVESINEENLKAAGKNQNHTADFKRMADMYHDSGISTHIAYIIGFPFDSEESVPRDIARLQSELRAEQASFFKLTPLPGSDDYRRFVTERIIIDADLNNLDGFHQTFRHARMNPGAWARVYEEAWDSFYGVENMKTILKDTSPRKYWGVFLNFVWYKNSIQVEGAHPLLSGFFRLKNRRERRSDWLLESRWEYFKRRVRDITNTLIGWLKLAFEMEEVWLATRQRSPLERRVLQELGLFQNRLTEWRNLRLSELQELYRKAAGCLDKSSSIRIPSRLSLWFKKWNVLSDSLTFTRSSMKRFWRCVLLRLRQGRIFEIRFHQMIFMGFRECALFARFILSFLRQTVFCRGDL